MRVKTLFISDIHLGCSHASTRELLDFLNLVKDTSPPEKIYIVGDFIDGWKLKRNWHWTDESSLVIRKLLSFLRRNTQLYWVAGNHDEFIREFIEDFHLLDFGHIHLGNEFYHVTADGRRLLVVHGDMFDMVSQYAKWLCWLGDIGYDILLKMNQIICWFRKQFRLKHWSLSKMIKANVKKAVNYVSDFEKCLAAYALDRECHGVVCGHIHTAALETLDGDFIYANTGDWVESCTAIYEDYEGQLHLYNHHESVPLPS
jgi:UDP-2,3-diacylglucosamine pyrophosphatase LpxH